MNLCGSSCTAVMGSFPSSSSPCSTPELPSGGSLTNENSENIPKRPALESSQRLLVRTTNQVAPIVIRNCLEEYQHVSELEDPVLFGRIAPGLPEHALIQNQYFLVKDVCPCSDRLGTLGEYAAPNVRRCRGRLPIYGMGQPTRHGLNKVIDSLKEDGFQNILLVNLRAEPVVFVAEDGDMVPYGPRHSAQLIESVHLKGLNAKAITELEASMRREVIALASLNDNHHFFFYKSVDQPDEEGPCRLRMEYLDDMALTDEVYAHRCFSDGHIQYLRLPLVPDGVPTEYDFDHFIDLFKRVPNFLGAVKPTTPAMVFTSCAGLERATLGMAMGYLVLAHVLGFPQEAGRLAKEEKKKSSRIECPTICRLVRLLPDGATLKQQVDTVLDLCDEFHNVREAAETACQTDRQHSPTSFKKDNSNAHLERYFFLICFNAYLKDQLSCHFAISFVCWLRQRCEIYAILQHIDDYEFSASPCLLADGRRALVADEYLTLDVLSTKSDVHTANLRGVKGIPVYGMAQPSRKGVLSVANHARSGRRGDPVVVLVNLRQDPVVECEGATYSWRDISCLERPLVIGGCTAYDVEEKEERLQKEILRKKVQVYHELSEPPTLCEFQHVLTPADTAELVIKQDQGIRYYRLPMVDDQAPAEQTFDALKDIVLGQEGFGNTNGGPVFVFNCRTGKGRTTTAMAIAGLLYFHKKGFPYGTKPGEEERVSLPNAKYTKGNYKCVELLVRLIPNGHQVKREVDFILDQCSDTMTPMHYHIREIIFVTLNKIKKARTKEAKEWCIKQSLDLLERYVYLILFNAYLHCEKWTKPFSTWMKEVSARVGVYDVLNDLGFPDLNIDVGHLRFSRVRWSMKEPV